jgi:hypothetical protein
MVKKKIKKTIRVIVPYILNSIFALKLAIYYLIVNSKDVGNTYVESMFSKLGINEKKLIGLMNTNALSNNVLSNTECNNLFINIDSVILSNYHNQIKKIKIELLEHIELKKKCKEIMDLGTEPKKELTAAGILDNMLPFIYSLIQRIYEDNQDIYNFDNEVADVDNSSNTTYNFDSFGGTPLSIIYSTLSVPYYAEIKDACTEIKNAITDKNNPFSIVKKLDNKYIPIGCTQDGTIAYAYVA